MVRETAIPLTVKVSSPASAPARATPAVTRAWGRTFWQHLPERFARVAALLGQDVSGMSVERAAQQLEPALARLLQAVGLDVRLRDLGVDRAKLPQMAADACRYMAGALRGAPGVPDCAAVTALLEASY